jgi:MtaA/CmuA family methyltransferase
MHRPPNGKDGMTGRDRILTMIEGRAPDSLPLMPITMMFATQQASTSYRSYVTDFKTLVGAQIFTAEKFDFDHVSCISDPTREAVDCGAAVRFFDDQPPAIIESQALLAEKPRLAGLKIPDPLSGGRMHDRVRAAALFKHKIGGQKLIEGWIEGPCAEAADLRGINALMLDFFDEPAFVRDLFDFVLEMEVRFAGAQIEAGVDIIGIGDAAASLVGPQIYQEFIFPYQKKMVDAVHNMGGRVRLHICGNTNSILAGFGRLGCEIVDLDWMVPLAQARSIMGQEQVLAGNIDPVAVLRNGTPKDVEASLMKCHQDAAPKYIVAAGCEVPRGTPEDNMVALRNFARSPKSG